MLSAATLAIAAPPLDDRVFAPSTRITGLLGPNPVNATCEVLLDLKTVNTTASQQQEPTSSQVASSVQTAMSLQIENLNSTAYGVRPPAYLSTSMLA